MANTSVDHHSALLILEKASKEASEDGFVPGSRLKDAVSTIISGTHLTYKYLLATGLLAKATNADANPLVLQAGADAPGAYDARSLCHKVIVPHENRLLNGGLGNSNEPFLNKPARFTMIALTNAVRAGNDRRTLNTLHEALSSVGSQREAYSTLRDLVYFARSQSKSQHEELSASLDSAVGGREQIAAFLTNLISVSVHGETSVLATAATLWILGRSRGKDWSVDVHPVNESGSSANEISDIDIRDNGELILSAEVKDKDFNMHDVEHAIEKVAQIGFNTMHFICGPRGKLKGGDVETLRGFARGYQVELYLLNLPSLVQDTVAFSPINLRLEDVVERVQRFALKARVKADTLRQIYEALGQTTLKQ